MNFKLHKLVVATLASSVLLGFGANAVADSTDDILNALKRLWRLMHLKYHRYYRPLHLRRILIKMSLLALLLLIYVI